MSIMTAVDIDSSEEKHFISTDQAEGRDTNSEPLITEAASDDGLIELTEPDVVEPDNINDVEFKEEGSGTSIRSKTYEAYLKIWGESVIKGTDAQKRSFIEFLDAQLQKYEETGSLEGLSIRSFDNTVKLHPQTVFYFPKELYPSPATVAGVGSIKTRYLKQLERIYRDPMKIQVLAFIAMRTFFYSGGRFNVKPVFELRKRKFDFLSILNDFVDQHMVQLLHVAEYFYQEMAMIEIQQEEMIKRQIDHLNADNSASRFHEPVVVDKPKEEPSDDFQPEQ